MLMSKLLIYLLFSITLLLAANNNECFSLIKLKDPVNFASCDSVIIFAGVVKRGTLVNEFLMDSSKIGYHIKIEHINGKYFWNILTSSYISKIEKWTCEFPFFRDRCISGLSIIVKFYPESYCREALISKKSCEKGYFEFLNDGENYKYYLNEDGIIHLRSFFDELISDIAKGMSSCCE